LRVKIEPNGSLTVTNKNTGKSFAHCNVFEDVGDVGDEYRHVKPQHDKVYTTLNTSPSVSKILDGALCAEYRIAYDFNVPESSMDNDRTRSDRLTTCRIVTDVKLRKGSPMVEFTTEIENTARDHRLRALFPSGIQTDVSHAEGQFDVLTRPVRPPVDWVNASPFHPQQGWVDVNDGGAGLTIINKGLPEYELYDDAKRTIALTLLRCVGRLSGGGNAPAAQKTPGAQCLGKYTFKYAMFPHSGSHESAKVWQKAHSHNVPVRVVQTEGHDGELPGQLGFVRVEPENLVVSAIKKAERSDSIILRFYNTTDEPVEGVVSFCNEVGAVNLVNLNEEFQQHLASSTDTVKIAVKPKQIVTLETVV